MTARWILALALAAPAGAQNLFDAPAMAEAGERLYRANCAVCHGIAAEGGRAPDLSRGMFRHGSRDEDLFRSINSGIKGSEMPGFPLEGRQTWQIISYLRGLAAKRKMPAPTGDIAAGKALFEGKRCTSCHRVGERGSRTGPDLSGVGQRLSALELRRALVSPGEVVTPRNWYVRAETADGRSVSGRRLNEDTYTVQLIDTDERLLSLVKAELRSVRLVRESAMPRFEGSEAEIAALTAYLGSLRE